MSYSLNSLKGIIWELYRVPITGLVKGDARSLDYGLYGAQCFLAGTFMVRTKGKRDPGALCPTHTCLSIDIIPLN